MLGEMSNIRATCASMSYSSEIRRRYNAHKLCIPFVYTKKKNVKIKRDNKKSYSNETCNTMYE